MSEETPQPVVPPDPPPAPLKLSVWKISLGLFLIVIVVSGLWGWRYLSSAVSKAAREVVVGEFASARRRLTNYLRFFSSDSRARLLLAESWVKDDLTLDGTERAKLALAELNKIPDEDSLGSLARLQEGKLFLLILYQPGRAYQSFLKSIELNPESPDPKQLLWSTMNLLYRFEAEDLAWTLYEKLPMEAKSSCLRDWFLTEFGPGSANLQLDRALGILAEGETPTSATELRRLQKFRQAEPDSSLVYTALANLFKREGHRSRALEILDEALKNCENPREDWAYLSIRAEVLIELGKLEEAQAEFDRWPESNRGYDYWRIRGFLEDESGKLAEAISSLEKSLDTVGGSTDWLSRNRMAGCLAQSGRKEEGSKQRALAKQIEKLMEPDYQRKLRFSLAEADNKETCLLVIDFYQQLGRTKEVAAWKKVLESLPK